MCCSPSNLRHRLGIPPHALRHATPRCARWGALWGAALVVLAPTSLRAQTRDHRSAVQSQGFEAFSDALSATDTTWIQPGWQDFTRYTTPAACLQAAISAIAVAERTVFRIKMPYAPLTDTLPTAAVTVAQRCGTQFSATNVSPDDALILFDLALLRRDTVLARAAARRYIVTRKDSTERAWALVYLIRGYMTNRPLLIAPAQALMQELDAFGRVAQAQRTIGRWEFWTYHSLTFDVAGFERDMAGLFAATKSMTSDDVEHLDQHEYRSYDYMTAVPNLLINDLEAFEVYAQNSLDLADSAEGHVAMLAHADTAVTNDQIRWTRKMLDAQNSWWTHLGMSIPKLPVHWWFGVPKETVWPTPNTTTLLVFDQQTDEGNENWYSILGRIHQKFGDKLHIVMIAGTQGYFRDSPPLTPEQEAEKIRWYYMDYLKLPVSAVAVAETPFSKLPDGRLVTGNVTWDRSVMNGVMPQHDGILLDRTGKIRGVELNWGTEYSATAVIERAIAGQ